MMTPEKTVARFEFPKELQPYVNIFYTREELTIIQALNGLILSEEELAARVRDEFGGMPEFSHFLRIAYRRDVVSKVETEEGIQYQLNPMNARVNNCATFEREIWETIPEKDRKYIADYHYQEFLKGKSKLSLEELSENANRVLPLDEIIDFLKSYGTDVATIIPCDCRSKFGGCGHSRNTCISLSKGINTPYDRGLGTPISVEETIELLRRTEKEGLMHSAEDGAICNCCGDCCYPTRAGLDLGLKGKWPAVSYVVELNQEKCVACGLCAKRCHFGVFTKEGKTMRLDAEKCWGCGICASACPKQALSLRKLAPVE